MPVDRAETLRSAEKLLRQGKLDLAIAEYLRVVADQPRDWNTANLLGDLYMRTGQSDKAVEQYVRIADSLKDEGFLSKAAALYKKVLKINPDDEHTLLQWAEVAASQGLLADARNALNAVGARRRSRGDDRGVAQIRIRLGALDPADFKARENAARARVEIGDVSGAVKSLTALAADLQAKLRHADAIEILQQAASINADDHDVRERLFAACLAVGDVKRARQAAATAEQLKSLAGKLETAGYANEAIDARREAARLDPADARLREELARTFVARGDVRAAAEYLTAEMAAEDPKLLITVAEIQLSSQDGDKGLAFLKRAIEIDPATREAVALLGWRIAEQTPESGFRIVEMAADAAVAQSDWAGAAAALQEFVTRVPNHIPALMRLVEICVDGGLEATMQSAQAELTDAYLASGAASEARFIAEDLVAREPWDRANVERFRRALVLLGEHDPDAIIAQRLSGQSPFTSTDLTVFDLPTVDGGARAEPDEPVAGAVVASGDPQPEQQPASESREEVVVTPAPDVGPARAVPAPVTDADRFELSANDASLESILGELEQATDKSPESAEIDLSVVLDDFKQRSQRVPTAPSRPPKPPVKSSDSEAASNELHAEALRLSAAAAEAKYKEALLLHKEGRIEEAIRALQEASKVPRLRFQTASLLGRIYRDRTSLSQAIECFERAAEAPAPTADEAYLLLYDLADALEAVGETARALAICLELQAEAGNYRDLAARIERLAKVQTRG